MDINQAIDRRLAQAKLVGWSLSKRRQIEITAGQYATLTLGWLDKSGRRAADDDEPGIDMRDIPPGISVSVYSPPPDTRDIIDVPSEADILAAAKILGCRHVDKGVSQGRIIYWMVK